MVARTLGSRTVQLALLTAVLCVGVVAAVNVQRDSGPALVPAGRLLDLHGRPVAPDETAAVSAEVVARMKAVPDAGGRFRIPSVGLDVPLGELSMAGGTITPPTYASAYVVRNLGAGPTRPRSGTVFVAMHSLRGGGTGPGNYLIDEGRDGTSLRPGSVIELDSVAYQVTRAELVDRDRIGDDATVWADVPGRLVVITCMQTPSGDRPPTQNLVIEARLSR
jgi:hypothetical protein